MTIDKINEYKAIKKCIETYDNKNSQQEEKEKLEKIIQEVDEWVESIDDTLTRQVAIMKTKMGMTYEQIGDELFYSRAHCNNLIIKEINNKH